MSPFKISRCGIPTRLIFGKRTGASINRTSHHRSRGSSHPGIRSIPPSYAQAHRAQEYLCSGDSSSLVLVHPQPTRQSTTPHWSRVLHHVGGPNQYKLLCPLFFEFDVLSFEIVVSERARGGRDLRARCNAHDAAISPTCRGTT